MFLLSVLVFVSPKCPRGDLSREWFRRGGHWDERSVGPALVWVGSEVFGDSGRRIGGRDQLQVQIPKDS